MFVITGEGVIAIESVNTEHAKGLLQAIGEVADQPVKYPLHGFARATPVAIFELAIGLPVFCD